MASMQPIEHDFDRVRRRVAGPPFREALQAVLRVDGVEGFYSGYVGDGRLIRAIAAADVDLSTDDHPVLEFSFARSLGRPNLFSASELQGLSASLGASRPAGRGTPPDWRRVDEMKRIRQSLKTLAVGGTAQPEHDGQVRDQARRAHADGDVDRAWSLWQQQPVPPDSSLDLLLVAEGKVRAKSDDATQAITALAAQRPAEASLLRAQWSPTVQSWQNAVEAVRTDAWIHEGFMQRSLAFLEEHANADLASAMFEALAEPFPGHLADHQRRLLRLKLASLFAGDAEGRYEEFCVAALGDMEPWVPWTRPILEVRLQCYEAAGHPKADEAWDDLRTFDREDSRSLGELVRQGIDRLRAEGP